VLKHVDADLKAWVQFYSQLLEQSALGYPDSTLSRVMDFGVKIDSQFNSRVPYLPRTPSNIKQLDRVLQCFPEKELKSFKQHYIDRQPVSLYRLNKFHDLVQGGLWTLRA